MVESQQSGDCTDHRALDARGLVAQSINLELQGLHRPPSTRCSGTGRPVYQLETSRTAPTTEHLMLGDWSPSLSTRNFKECTDHRVLSARGLVVKSVGIAPTAERLMLRDWSPSLLIWESAGCTDLRALYTQGLVDQLVKLISLFDGK